MFTKQMKKVADVLIEKEISKSEHKDLVVYGLSAGIELVFNIITTILLGFLFGLILESIVFLISFSFLRTYAGGYHCQKAINCYLTSNGIMVLVMAIVKFTPKEHIIIIGCILLLMSIPVLLKFAPMETPSKPLNQDERKYYRKKVVVHLGIECAVIPILFWTGLHNFSFVVCLGIVVSAYLVFAQK